MLAAGRLGGRRNGFAVASGAPVDSLDRRL